MSDTRRPLPQSIGELTPEWLGAALGLRHPGISVTGAEAIEVIWGTSTKVRMHLTYGEPTQLPENVCVKGGFDVEKGFGNEAQFLIETKFFAEVAPQLDVPLPRCYYAEYSEPELQGIVILDDLVATGCTFGDPLKPWTPARVAAALEVQAAWHAQAWQATAAPFAELEVGASAVRGAAGVLLGEEHWNAHFANEGAPRLPAEMQDRERVLRGFHALWERDAQGPLTLVHGDAHVGNTYISTEGQPAFLDWPGVCRAPAFYDVAYFIGGALETEVRREAERDLVQHYLRALSAGGGPVLDFDDAWTDYRRYALHGMLWAVTPPVMQSPERVQAMGERYGWAAVDHRSLDVLGV